MIIFITDNYTYPYSPFIKMQSYKTNSLALFFCISGYAIYQIGETFYKIEKDHFLAIKEDSEFSRIEASDDYKIEIIHFERSIYNRVTDNIGQELLYYLINIAPLQKVSGARARILNEIMNYIKPLSQKNDDKATELILLEYIRVFLFELCNTVLDSISTETTEKYTKKIWKQFFTLVKENYTEQHQVQFYADKLSVTPKNLTRIITEITKRTPSEWIYSSIMRDAIRQLKDNNISIKTIAYNLNFSSPSHFISFFRKHTGISPKEFRKQSNESKQVSWVNLDESSLPLGI